MHVKPHSPMLSTLLGLSGPVLSASVVDGASPGSIGQGQPFSTSNISGRCPRATAKSNAAPAASYAIAKGPRRPAEDGDRARAPVVERNRVPPKCTLWGARGKGLTEVAPVPKAGSSRDACGACPNWDAITASPEKTTLRSLAGRERSDTSGERRPLPKRAAASPRNRIVGSHLRESLGRGADEA